MAGHSEDLMCGIELWRPNEGKVIVRLVVEWRMGWSTVVRAVAMLAELTMPLSVAAADYG